MIDSKRSARTAGTAMTRREALAAAAGGIVLASCGESFGSLEPDAPEPPAFVKDPSNFIVHGSNLEARLEDMDGLLTPVDRFFVRNHSPTPSSTRTPTASPWAAPEPSARSNSRWPTCVRSPATRSSPT